jgi:protein-L-isoaspartate(D-aspartate) O-methyltransferase
MTTGKLSKMPSDRKNSKLKPGTMDEEKLYFLRQKMVEEQIIEKGITSPAVINAMLRVPRHKFVPPYIDPEEAYEDKALPIGYGQTISQPYVVAAMTQALMPALPGKILEIGVGSGYQTAILLELGAEVWGFEIVKPLADRAIEVLTALGYKNFHIIHGDGKKGLEDISLSGCIIAAAADSVPEGILSTIELGGVVVAPINVPGKGYQKLIVMTRKKEGWEKEVLFDCKFVPLV